MAGTSGNGVLRVPRGIPNNKREWPRVVAIVYICMKRQVQCMHNF